MRVTAPWTLIYEEVGSVSYQPCEPLGDGGNHCPGWLVRCAEVPEPGRRRPLGD